MYESHTFKLTSVGKRFFGTRKNSMRVIVVDKPVELNGGYWDGGSRDCYFGLTKSGTQVTLSYPTAPPQFGGGTPPGVLPTKDLAICKSGTFCGKDAGVTAYVTSLEDWHKPEWFKD